MLQVPSVWPRLNRTDRPGRTRARHRSGTVHVDLAGLLLVQERQQVWKSALRTLGTCATPVVSTTGVWVTGFPSLRCRTRVSGPATAELVHRTLPPECDSLVGLIACSIQPIRVSVKADRLEV